MDFQKHRLILAMIETLREQGSRTGKTHIIKGLLLAQAAGLLKVPFEFFLYKHGPYSTDIEEAFEQMRSYGAIEVKPAFDNYGVLFEPGEMASFVKERATLSKEESIGTSQVCEFIHLRNVSQLEQLATAAWIRSREDIQDPEAVAQRLHELKPHISLADARKADREFVSFFQKSCLSSSTPEEV